MNNDCLPNDTRPKCRRYIYGKDATTPTRTTTKPTRLQPSIPITTPTRLQPSVVSRPRSKHDYHHIFTSAYKGRSYTKYRSQIPDDVYRGAVDVFKGYEMVVQNSTNPDTLYELLGFPRGKHTAYENPLFRRKIYGYALDNENKGRISLLGAQDQYDTPFVRDVINGKNTIDRRYGSVLGEIVDKMYNDGIREIELNSHSLGAYRGRTSLPKIASMYPRMKFKLNMLNGHFRSPKNLPDIPENLDVEYHTINTDLTNLKDHYFRKEETKRGAKFFEYPANEPNMTNDRFNHGITEFDTTKPRTKVPSTVVNAADFGFGLGAGIAGEYLAPDKKRGFKHDAEALGIGASIYAGGKSLLQSPAQFIVGGMNTEAATGAALTGLSTGAAAGGTFLVGGAAGYGASKASNYVLDKVGVENEDIKDPVNSTVGGAASGAAVGALFAPETLGLSVAVGAGIGAALGGLSDVWRHRRDIKNFFSRKK